MQKHELEVMISKILQNGADNHSPADIILPTAHLFLYLYSLTLRAKLSGVVYCYRSCLCVCNGRAACLCLWVCYHDNLGFACINPHQTEFVGKGSDHLQLIKFWPSHASGKGFCGRAKIFWLYVTASAQRFFSLSECTM